ncbi:MAG: aminotransferase class I/II-fold pyridoxal phosphate-dependent enzyme [Terracidiphilus sp.]|jgi:threonine-phosphate decarboxylase
MCKGFLPEHGGQLSELAAEFGVPETSLVDFSASIDPHPPSDLVVATLCDALRARTILTAYPDMHYVALKDAIAAYAQVDVQAISINSGVMPLLGAALSALRPRQCLVSVPAFAEYRKVLETCGVECCAFASTPETGFLLDGALLVARLKDSGPQVLLLANPQSPSGRLMPARELLQLHEAASALGATTIVDEAFIDYAPGDSLSEWAAKSPRLIVLRSLTKFFAMPGLRIAYAVCCPEMRVAIESRIPAWPVSSIAAEAARIVLHDRPSIANTRATNAAERSWLTEQLQARGLCVFPGAANYLLMKIDENRNGAEFWQRLIIEHRVVLRSCANFECLDEHYFRIGVRTRSQNELLVRALKEALQPTPRSLASQNQE